MRAWVAFWFLFLALLPLWHKVHAVDKAQFSPSVDKPVDNATYAVRLLMIDDAVIGVELRWSNRGEADLLLEWPVSGCTIDLTVVIEEKDFKRPYQKFVLPDGVFRTSKGVPTRVLKAAQSTRFFVKIGSLIDAEQLPRGRTECVVRARPTVYVKGMTPRGIDIPIPTITFKKCSVSKTALRLDADRLYEYALIDEAAK